MKKIAIVILIIMMTSACGKNEIVLSNSVKVMENNPTVINEIDHEKPNEPDTSKVMDHSDDKKIATHADLYQLLREMYDDYDTSIFEEYTYDANNQIEALVNWPQNTYNGTGSNNAGLYWHFKYTYDDFLLALNVENESSALTRDDLAHLMARTMIEFKYQVENGYGVFLMDEVKKIEEYEILVKLAEIIINAENDEEIDEFTKSIQGEGSLILTHEALRQIAFIDNHYIDIDEVPKDSYLPFLLEYTNVFKEITDVNGNKFVAAHEPISHNELLIYVNEFKFLLYEAFCE